VLRASLSALNQSGANCAIRGRRADPDRKVWSVTEACRGAIRGRNVVGVDFVLAGFDIENDEVPV
jgi:hypothetical protein